MEQQFKLHWLRANRMDLDTMLTLDQLHPSIQTRVQAAAEGMTGVIEVRLPYLDDRELRRPFEILSALEFERRGSTIGAVLNARLALRTTAAECALASPVWAQASQISSPARLRMWQRVSTSLQRALRAWIAAEHFCELEAFENRERAYPVLVYQTARVFQPRVAGEYTYDLQDYPHSTKLVESAWRMTSTAMRRELAIVERRLLRAGRRDLAARYSPRWQEDIQREVRRKPRQFADLLIRETEFINTLIDLGISRNAAAVCRFTRIASQQLRHVAGHDLRHLGVRALELTTEILREAVEHWRESRRLHRVPPVRRKRLPRRRRLQRCA